MSEDGYFVTTGNEVIHGLSRPEWEQAVTEAVAHPEGRGVTDDAVLWAFEYMFHMDKANACMHCAPVKFSPLTFRLAHSLMDDWSGDMTPELQEVLDDIGKYELDPGR